MNNVCFIRLCLKALMLVSLETSVSAQVIEDWVAHYDGEDNDADYARDLEMDRQGNIYAVGTSMNMDDGADIVTISLDHQGVERWAARFDGTDGLNDWGYSIAIDTAANIYVCGSSQFHDTGKDFVIIKYDNTGNELWVRYYNGPANRDDEAIQIEVDCAGNVVAAGTSQGLPGASDYSTLKFDSDGELVWSARYSGPGENIDEARALAVDRNENVYVSGGSIGDSTDYDFATVKYSGEGTELWTARYDGPAHGFDMVYYAGSVLADDAGNVYLTGYSEGMDFASDFLTVKYDQAGNLVWAARYDGLQGNDYADALCLDLSGNVYVTGGSYNAESGYDFLTIKYNSQGAIRWTAVYNGDGNGWDEAYGVAIDRDDNVYITGRSVGDNTGADFATLKYSPSGDQLWIARYDGSAHEFDWPFRLLVDQSLHVYIAGQSIEEDNDSDYTIIKYEQTQSSVGESDLPSSQSILLCENYPNPFNSSTEIRYLMPESGHVRLSIYNIIGQKIALLVDNEQSNGYHEIKWNAENESSGIYFYKLETKNATAMESMILIK